jgi:hypothetical protein
VDGKKDSPVTPRTERGVVKFGRRHELRTKPLLPQKNATLPFSHQVALLTTNSNTTSRNKFMCAFFGEDFWRDSATTTLGILIGVPVALWIERKKKRDDDLEERHEIEDHTAHALERNRSALNLVSNYYHSQDYLFAPPTTIFDIDAFEFVVPRLYAVGIDYDRCRKIEVLRFRMKVWNRFADLMSQHFDSNGTDMAKAYSILVERGKRAFHDAENAFTEAAASFQKRR